MTDETREPSSSTTPQDSDRAVEKRIASAIGSTRRAIRTHTLLGVAVIGVLVGWGRWLYASVSQIDASYVASYARERVETGLPSAQDLFADHLRRAAPTVVNRALEHLLYAPTALSQRLQRMFEDEVDRLGAGLEVELADRMRADIGAARRQLDTRMAGIGDRERVDFLAREFVSDYRRNVERVLHHHAGPFADSMDTLRRDLDRLGHGRGLTERERLQREILACFLELHRRAVERGEDGPPVMGIARLFGSTDG